MKLHADCERMLFSAEEIAAKIGDAAAWLDGEYGTCADAAPVAVCVLKGAVFFFCDLVRRMKTPVSVEFLRASSYRLAARSGQLQADKKLSFDPAGRDILLVEDIVDSGKTLQFLRTYFLSLGAKSVKTAVLLDKVSARTVPFRADCKCFDIENEFVVGYGMDYAERYRSLPYIAVLKREIYAPQEKKG